MKLKLALLVSIFFYHQVFACSLNIQQMLLSERSTVLTQAPVGMFYDEITRWSRSFEPFVQPRRLLDQATFEDIASDQYEYYYDSQRTFVESKFLSPGKLDLVNKARAADSLQQAQQILAGQKGSFVDYTLASVAFLNGEGGFDNPYSTVPYPDLKVKNDPWRLWGLMMKGKLYYESGHYQQTLDIMTTVLDFIDQGMDDPLKIYADSKLWQARAQMKLEMYDESIENLLRLHAGHTVNAPLQLRGLAKELVFTNSQLNWKKPTEAELSMQQQKLAQAIQSPLLRKLLIIYAYTYLAEDYNSLLTALVNSDLKSIEAADQLAAYAYRLGNYEDAHKLAQLSDSDLAKVISAKLSIREGELQKASELYSSIIEKFKAESFEDLSAEACTRIAENALLVFSNGNIEEAFDLLLNHTRGEYWQDIAYIAEHLLPTELLIEKVKHMSLPLSETTTDSNRYYYNSFADEGAFAWSNKYGEEVTGVENKPIKALHHLLARRLVRENRDQEALRFFVDDVLQKRLETYISMQKSINASSGTEKAQKTFQLAQWIMQYGWRLMAFEGFPDWYMFEVNFTAWFTPPSGQEDKNVFVPQQELDLLLQNKTSNTLARYSYRYKAIELARQAANLLDPKAPEFENYLCHASSWAMNLDLSLGQEIFKEFVHKAKPIKDRKYFGAICNAIEPGQ